MPIYEYRCSACDAKVEVLVRGDTTPVCPHCGTLLTDKLLSVPSVASGRTAREPGRTCCGREERCDRPPCSAGEACWRG
mgnify:CR=1 FL=1